MLIEPGEGPLDDPSLRQQDEPPAALRPPDDLEDPAARQERPVDERASISGVGPHDLQSADLPTCPGQHLFRPVPILRVSGMHDDGDDQPQRVDQQVPLAAVHFFSPRRSRPRRPDSWS